MKVRIQVVLVFFKIADELGWYRSFEGFICTFTVVSCIRYHADFIFHLDQDNGLFAFVNRSYMFHQRRESPSIRSPVSVVKRCEYLLCSSVFLMSSREFLLVGFYPYRHVARHAIFPRPKPKEYQLHIVQPRRSNDAIDKGEIEHSFLWLQKFPIHRHNKCIQVHLDNLGPDRASCIPGRLRSNFRSHPRASGTVCHSQSIASPSPCFAK